VIDTKLRLFGFGVFFVAGEGELRVVFVPGEPLILAFAAEQDGWWTVAIGVNEVDAVRVFFLRRGCKDELFSIFANREVEHVAELSFVAGSGVPQNELSSVFFLLC
jgi:hypothetical protein